MRWYPCLFAIPKAERALLSLACVGPRGILPNSVLVLGGPEGEQGDYYFEMINQEANALTSLFIVFRREPSHLIAGSKDENFVIWGKSPA